MASSEKQARAYTIIVAYDGTQYQGWQEQKNSSSSSSSSSTIAGVLQDAFLKVFGHTIKTVGASRTDAGVHATHQVARFYTHLTISPEILAQSWNGALPRDIHITSLELTSAGFHPQHNVLEKTYTYHFSVARSHPLYARFVYHHSHPIDLQKLEKCLQLFVGTHDFVAFCSGPCPKGGTVCTINQISLDFNEQLQAYGITVKGKRFLQHMIRRMVGAALTIAAYKNRTSQEILTALEQKKAVFNLPTAPACGLMLTKIEYLN